MINKTAWSKYIDDTSGVDQNTAIARKVGVDNSTVGRWRTGATDPSPRQVVAYANAYGHVAVPRMRRSERQSDWLHRRVRPVGGPDAADR